MSASQPAGPDRLEPWTSRTRPDDVSRRHTEAVTLSGHEYVLEQNGTLDGENCREPQSGVFPGRQTWESNRLVRMENVGQTDLVNPWLSNGRNNFRSIEEIAAAVVEPGMTDAEKVWALWYQQTTHRYHFSPADREVKNPVKVFNVYGYNTCGDDSNCLAGLWRQVGLKVSPARLMGHCISQAFYDGDWHMLDGDEGCIYLRRDNQTVANCHDVARDHDLIKRSHVGGVGHPDDLVRREKEAAEFVYEGDTLGTRDAIGTYTMDMVLRPGEAIVWRWGHLDPLKYHGTLKARYSDTICNGLREYHPDLTGNLWRRGATRVEGIQDTPDGLTATPGHTGVVVWTMKSPYIFVGGRLEHEGKGVKFSLSWDGLQWEPIEEGLDPFFPQAGPPRYKYLLKCELAPGTLLKRIGIINDLQMAPLALPGMRLGRNRFVYTDQTPTNRSVRITHEWVERSSSRPPASPVEPVYPLDGGETESTQFAFTWSVPEHPDALPIVDYHFELSDRPDLKWPLSPAFSRLISFTPDKDTPRFTLPYPEMITPDRIYYWRVRAKDERGVWGPWSSTWSFTPRGPAHPVDVHMTFDVVTGTGTLHWKPNPVGRRPVKYRVYGSDEKGFSVSDEPYPVHIGTKERKLPTPFPANFAAESESTQLDVVGVGLEFPNANRAYYRVVAVDQTGNRSWSSDYVESPRPFIFSVPLTEACVGKEYRHVSHAIRSIGDLCHRGRVVSFSEVESVRFALEHAPDWLSIDEESGVLSGIPTAPGQDEVTVTAVIERDARLLDARILAWGREKIASADRHVLGPVRQTFVIQIDSSR